MATTATLTADQVAADLAAAYTSAIVRRSRRDGQWCDYCQGNSIRRGDQYLDTREPDSYARWATQKICARHATAGYADRTADRARVMSPCVLRDGVWHAAVDVDYRDDRRTSATRIVTGCGATILPQPSTSHVTHLLTVSVRRPGCPACCAAVGLDAPQEPAR